MSVTVTTRPLYLNANSNVYGAWDLRGALESEPPGAGVAGWPDFRVIQRQAGANMSVDIGATGVGLMRAWVRGSVRGGQGLYAIDNIDRTAPTTDSYVAQLNDVVTANASGNPRLDQVVLEVLDQQHAGASNLAQIRIVAGTPTGGATLDNRTGAAALPTSSILLADILVPNGAASIVTSNIRDRRQYPILGSVPVPSTVGTALDQVAFMPAAGLAAQLITVAQAAVTDTMQSAALMFLPRRIVGATRVRWKWRQGATANAANWIIGIYDTSGRQIVATSATAFTGTANQDGVASATIAATTFDAGLYYVVIGVAAATASSIVYGLGVSNTAAVGVAGSGPNLMLVLGSGGTTLPTTLGGFADAHASGAPAGRPGVPIVTLSVG